MVLQPHAHSLCSQGPELNLTSQHTILGSYVFLVTVIFWEFNSTEQFTKGSYEHHYWHKGSEWEHTVKAQQSLPVSVYRNELVMPKIIPNSILRHSKLSNALYNYE